MMPRLNHVRFGVVNHIRVGSAETMGSMESRARLAKNLSALMEKSPDLSTQGALHRRSKVAQSTIGRILSCETSPTVDTLDQIAGAFGLSSWQLIHPKPDMKPGEAEFYAQLRRLLDETTPKP